MDKKIIILTAPSGAGKTSIVKYLLKEYADCLSFSISATTRKKRDTEIDRKDYYFLTEGAFLQQIRENKFIEWEMVYEGTYYGTLLSEMERIWSEGKTPVLDIDVKGALHIQKQFVHDVLSVFVQPPSVDELRNRLLSRGTETAETLKARINKAAYELSFKDHFNYIITNNELEQACKDAEKVIIPYVGGRLKN